MSGNITETLHVAEGLANKIATRAPLALRGAKEVIDTGLDLTLEQHLELAYAKRAPLTDTMDHQEALNAFNDNKRPPIFTGR